MDDSREWNDPSGPKHGSDPGDGRDNDGRGLPKAEPDEPSPYALVGYGAGEPYGGAPPGTPPPSGPSGPASRHGPELTRYLEVIRHRRRLVLGILGVVVAGVMLGTFLQDPIYRATGIIEIRMASEDVMPVDELFQLARIPDQYMETQYGVLRSPTLARRVAVDLRLYELEEFNRNADRRDGTPMEERPVATAAGGEEGPEDGLWSVVDKFDDRLSVEPVEGSRLVEVSFESKDPRLAANVVNSVFANYVALRTEAARLAAARLASQVDSARLRVGAAERQLQQLVGSNELLYVEGGSGEVENVLGGRLQQLQTQLTDAEGVLYEQESRWRLIEQGDYDALDSQVLQSLNVQIAELEGEYARLRAIFTDDYPRTKQARQQLEAMREQATRERNRIATEIRNAFQAAQHRYQLLARAVEEQKGQLDRFAGEAAEYRILRRDVIAQQELYQQLQQKEKEAGVSAALAATQVTVVDPAVAPRDPVRPSPGRNLALAVIVGLLLGVGAALTREYLDPRVNSVEEIDEMAGVPILALIPSARVQPARRGRNVSAPATARRRLAASSGAGAAEAPAVPWVRIDQQDWKNSALSDAFSTLRTSVLFESEGPLPRSLLVTSIRAGEGKTTIAINLAISLARLDRRVLLVDADVRRPSVHRAFAVDRYPGLTEYLSSSADWRGFIRPQPLPGLDILPAGRTPEGPSELLSTGRARELIKEAEHEYDFVVVDSPALLVNVADARILAPLADGIVLVVRNGITPRELLRRVLRRTPNVIGLVMNDLRGSLFSSYYQEYPVEREEAEETAGDKELAQLASTAWSAGGEGDETSVNRNAEPQS